MKNIMKIEQVASCLDKFKMYTEQEQLLNEDLMNCLGEISNIYQSNNSKKIDDLNSELVSKIKNITNIHNNNAKVIDRAIEKYRNADTKARKLFEDIEIR